MLRAALSQSFPHSGAYPWSAGGVVAVSERADNPSGLASSTAILHTLSNPDRSPGTLKPSTTISPEDPKMRAIMG